MALSGLLPVIRIRGEVASSITAQACSSPGIECCGLLAGREGIITHAFPATNAAANPATSYDVAVIELVRLMREIRAANLELLGIYHSHPSSANEPSPTDIELAAYPEAAYFILSPQQGAPKRMRAFSIREGIVKEFRIEIVEQ
jgi:[CysO sulfur-carrier protein]-S-L-cysteine hydrolase